MNPKPSFRPIDFLSRPVREAVERLVDRNAMRLAAVSCAKRARSMCHDLEPLLAEAIAIGEKYARGQAEWADLGKIRLAISAIVDERRARFCATPHDGEAHMLLEAATCAAACLEANGLDAIAKAAADFQAVARAEADMAVSQWFIDAGNTMLVPRVAGIADNEMDRGLGWLPDPFLERISRSDSLSQRRFAIHCAKKASEIAGYSPSSMPKILALSEAMAAGDARSSQVEDARGEAERVMGELLSSDGDHSVEASVVGVMKGCLDESAERAALRCAEGLNKLMIGAKFDTAAMMVASTIRDG